MSARDIDKEYEFLCEAARVLSGAYIWNDNVCEDILSTNERISSEISKLSLAHRTNGRDPLALNLILALKNDLFSLASQVEFYHVKNKMAYKKVYVMDLSNGLVKIGVSSNIQQRITEIERINNCTVKKCSFTRAFPHSFTFEKMAHKYFGKYRVQGEYFNIRYNDAVDYLNNVLKKSTKELKRRCK